ncbi:MAG: helix-turn-helix transcriptional regulator [Pseudobdellovibrionaceae bacterium]|nr:MAG: helix-turn-helix transcriptional regulator [Pseudobdellovibrionaceae bacterium]
MSLKVIQNQNSLVGKTSRLDKIPVKHRKSIEAQLRNISFLVQNRRKEMGLTQEELAEKLDISVLTLQSIEQGWRFPSLPTLFYLCKIMGISIVFNFD